MSQIGQSGNPRVSAAEMRLASQPTLDVIRKDIWRRIETHLKGSAQPLAPYRCLIGWTANNTKLPKVIRDELKEEGYRLFKSKEKGSTQTAWYADWEKPRKNSDVPGGIENEPPQPSPSDFAPQSLAWTGRVMIGGSNDLPRPPPRA